MALTATLSEDASPVRMAACAESVGAHLAESRPPTRNLEVARATECQSAKLGDGTIPAWGDLDADTNSNVRAVSRWLRCRSSCSASCVPTSGDDVHLDGS
jgi:hypothetical protein